MHTAARELGDTRSVPRGVPLLAPSALAQLPAALSTLRLSRYCLLLPLPPGGLGQLAALEELELESCTALALHLPGGSGRGASSASASCSSCGGAAGAAASDSCACGSASSAGSAAGSGGGWERLRQAAQRRALGQQPVSLPPGAAFTEEPLLPVLLGGLPCGGTALRCLRLDLGGVSRLGVVGALGGLPQLTQLCWVYRGSRLGKDLEGLAALPALQRGLRTLVLRVASGDAAAGLGLGVLAALSGLRCLSLGLEEGVKGRGELRALSSCSQLRRLELCSALPGELVGELRQALPACCVSAADGAEARRVIHL